MYNTSRFKFKINIEQVLSMSSIEITVPGIYLFKNKSIVHAFFLVGKPPVLLRDVLDDKNSF